MRYIDLFAGIGGFRLGIEKVNKKYKCVYSNEWDKYASLIYKKHYGECDTRDIRKVKAKEIPDHDLLCAGFPCQSFSIAGKRKGFDDTRGTMFFEIARILSEKRPGYFLLENVKGLLSSQQGKTFQTILGVLSDLGYRVEWQVLNSKHFGVPQNRERVFIVGHLGKGSRQQVFPIGQTRKVDNDKDKKLSMQVSNTLRTNYSTGFSNETYILKEITKNQSQGMRVYKTNGVSTTIAGEAGGWGAKTGLYQVKPVLTPDRLNKRQNGRRMKDDGEPSFTLTSQDKHGVMINTRIRRLTPVECARLQGFPDDWCDILSHTQQYKCYGNAVTTNVVSAIITKMRLR